MRPPMASTCRTATDHTCADRFDPEASQHRIDLAAVFQPVASGEDLSTQEVNGSIFCFFAVGQLTRTDEINVNAAKIVFLYYHECPGDVSSQWFSCAPPPQSAKRDSTNDLQHLDDGVRCPFMRT